VRGWRLDSQANAGNDSQHLAKLDNDFTGDGERLIRNETGPR
jgi:hypothetical protein